MSHMMFSTGPAFHAYNLARKLLTLSSFACTPVLLLINAPFGRFAPKSSSILVFDGRKAWVAMEIFAPIVFLYSLATAPLAQQNPGLPTLNSPRGLLVVLFLIHYANRAILSPLRTPSRSGHHIIVALSGILFNVLNGFMLGSYLSNPFTLLWFQSPRSTQRFEYKLGLFLWAFGFIGNLAHDEILLNIRRKANATGKARESIGQRKEEHYAIPYGLLYKYISYPNYFCEWIEWLGFALAAGPLPFRLSSLSISTALSFLSPLHLASVMKQLTTEPAVTFAPNLSPPWIFFIAEVATMLPRAYKGHLWYKQKFGDSYPKNRKIVIPFVL